MSRTAIGEETETREVVVKRGEYVRNPDTNRMNVIYNEHVETIDVPAKISDRNKAREMLAKYHSLFTDKLDVSLVTPEFVDDIQQMINAEPLPFIRWWFYGKLNTVLNVKIYSAILKKELEKKELEELAGVINNSDQQSPSLDFVNSNDSILSNETYPVKEVYYERKRS